MAVWLCGCVAVWLCRRKWQSTRCPSPQSPLQLTWVHRPTLMGGTRATSTARTHGATCTSATKASALQHMLDLGVPLYHPVSPCAVAGVVHCPSDLHDANEQHRPTRPPPLSRSNECRVWQHKCDLQRPRCSDRHRHTSGTVNVRVLCMFNGVWVCGVYVGGGGGGGGGGGHANILCGV